MQNVRNANQAEDSVHKVCESSEVTWHQLHPDVKADVVHLWSDVRQAGKGEVRDEDRETEEEAKAAANKR